MKVYRLTTTTTSPRGTKTSILNYCNLRQALELWQWKKNYYAKHGYILADAGAGENWRAELWTSDYYQKNIEIYPVDVDPAKLYL